MPTKPQFWEDGKNAVKRVSETDGSGSEQVAANLYAWDATAGAYVKLTVDHATGNLNVTGGGGGGGGAVTIADGADVAQGTTTDLSTANTVVGILKAIKAAVQGTLTTARNWTLSSGTDSVTVAGTVTANVGTTNGLALDATLTGGSQKAIARGGAKGTTAAADLTSNPIDANTQALHVDGSKVTQPVSGTVTVQQATAANLKVDLSGTGANATALKVDGSAVTQPVSVAGTIAENLTQVGGVAVAATAKGTQGTNLIPTQDAKDSGRTPVVLFLDAVTGITTEALATMGITKGGVAQTSATSYTVTAGKTLRITGLHTTVKNTSTVASDSRVRVRQAASAISVSSPIILLNEAGSPAAIANSAGTDDTVIPDGYEVAGGQQIAISHVESATTCTLSVCLIGYEY